MKTKRRLIAIAAIAPATLIPSVAHYNYAFAWQDQGTERGFLARMR